MFTAVSEQPRECRGSRDDLDHDEGRWEQSFETSRAMNSTCDMSPIALQMLSFLTVTFSGRISTSASADWGELGLSRRAESALWMLQEAEPALHFLETGTHVGTKIGPSSVGIRCGRCNWCAVR